MNLDELEALGKATAEYVAAWDALIAAGGDCTAEHVDAADAAAKVWDRLWDAEVDADAGTGLRSSGHTAARILAPLVAEGRRLRAIEAAVRPLYRKMVILGEYAEPQDLAYLLIALRDALGGEA